VAVQSHNFYVYQDTVPVITPTHAIVVIDSFTVDDDMGGGSFGNSNGKADDGETVETVVSLINVGPDSALSTSAVLRASDPYVTVTDSAGNYGTIPPDSTVVPPWEFLYEVAPSVPDSHVVEFALTISHTDTSYAKHFSILTSAPVLALADVSVSDTLSGNGDNCIEATETIELRFTLENKGSGDGEGVTVLLTEDDPYLELIGDSAYVAMVPAGGQAEPLPPFAMEILPECPDFHEITLGIDFQFASGRQASGSTSIYVGGLLDDDVEGGTPGWTHSDFQDGYVDEWHLEDYRNHTAGGTYSWKFGGSGSTRYSDLAHGALMTPELCLGPNATLTFWHYCRAEILDDNYAWDGGVVEISTDGGETWVQITPAGGYDRKIWDNPDSPFPAETPCFARTTDWEEEEFDLSAYEGRARIRFRFGSDGYVGAEGWYIDDIRVEDDKASVDTGDRYGEIMPVEFALKRVVPNPLSSKGRVAFDIPRPSWVVIELYDVRGRVVERLADSAFKPGRYSLAMGGGRELASGMYFLRMQADGFSDTQKVVVLK
jgi:hypothetical protein